MMTSDDAQRLPGLYRIWDLQFVLDRESDFTVHHAGETEDGTPLFAIYRHSQRTDDPKGPLQ